MVKITDIYGNYYDIPDIQRFKEHIIKYHTNDCKADNSIHEENGFYFKIDNQFFDNIKNL